MKSIVQLSLAGFVSLFLLVVFLMKPPGEPTPTAPEKPLPSNCSNGQPAHPLLGKSTDPRLQKLAEYEVVCHGAVADELMVFTSMPVSSAEAQDFAEYMAAVLKDFSKHGIAPLVVFEPTMERPAIVAEIRRGEYDPVLKEYYSAMKSRGITDQHMGTWVLFPEANTPMWQTTRPEDFTANVTKVAQMQKQAFPRSKATILLNSHTHPDNDTSWSHGELKSLVPYVADIPKGLIDSFGLQGFPYVTPANESEKHNQTRPSDFLPARLAAEAANAMGTKDIWLNTGTFSRMHVGDPAAEVSMTPEKRQEILDGVIEEVKTLRAQDYSLLVNLFSEDKSKVEEGVDWSYWQAGKADASPATKVFDEFVRHVRHNDGQFSLYDSNE